MLIVYMMAIYVVAILLLSVLTYFTSLRVTKVKQTFKHLALANAFALVASAVVGAALNVAQQWLPSAELLAILKPLVTLALSIIIYGQAYSRQLKDASGQNIPAKLGYLISGANFAIILIIGFTLVFTVSFFD